MADVLEIQDKPALAPVSELKTKPKPRTAPKADVKRTQAPEPASAQQTESSAPTSEPLIRTSDLVAAWKNIRLRVKQSSPNLEALLNSCKSLEVRGDTLILGLASEVLVEKIKKPDQIEVAKKAIADETGATLEIRCVVTNAKGKIPDGVDQNGLVAAAIQAGGEVVDIQE